MHCSAERNFSFCVYSATVLFIPTTSMDLLKNEFQWLTGLLLLPLKTLGSRKYDNLRSQVFIHVECIYLTLQRRSRQANPNIRPNKTSSHQKAAASSRRKKTAIPHPRPCHKPLSARELNADSLLLQSASSYSYPHSHISGI